MNDSEKESKQVTEVSQRDRATPHNLRKYATTYDTKERKRAGKSGTQTKGVKCSEKMWVRVRVRD